MTRYARDPRWINSRFAGTDKNGKPYQKGQRVFFYPATKAILTGEEAEKAALDFEGAAADEANF